MFKQPAFWFWHTLNQSTFLWQHRCLVTNWMLLSCDVELSTYFIRCWCHTHGFCPRMRNAAKMLIQLKVKRRGIGWWKQALVESTSLLISSDCELPVKNSVSKSRKEFLWGNISRRNPSLLILASIHQSWLVIWYIQVLMLKGQAKTITRRNSVQPVQTISRAVSNWLVAVKMASYCALPFSYCIPLCFYYLWYLDSSLGGGR